MKSKLKFLPVIPVILIIGVLILSYIKANPSPYADIKPDTLVPEYEEVELNHTHKYDGSDYLPVMGSAIIDIDDDGKPEVFIGGGVDQDDSLFRFDGTSFKKLTEIKFNKENADATYGASVADFNNDGKDDLLIARESGAHLYYNLGAGKFEHKAIDLKLNAKSRGLTFALGDLNNDGHIDMYVSAYLTRHKMEGQNIFNQKNYGGTSALLINNGDDTFENITAEAGMTYIHNTFLGIFVDMDDDRDLDLVVAHDTGRVKVWENLGGLKFRDSKTPFSDLYGYPMGIGAGDYNNDGLVDFYFSNTGPTAPRFLAKGDLRDDQTYYSGLMLMENKGSMNFINSANKAKLEDYEFSWGVTMADLNNDSRQDIIISENYVDFPLHKIFKLPGRVLLQNKDMTYASVEAQTKTENRNYEIAALLADFNGDGYLDQVRVNLAGKTKAFISKGGKNKYLRVKVASNAKMLGSKVIVTMSNGSKLYDWNISGEGLCSDQEHTMQFGLGESLTPTNVSVLTMDGSVFSKDITAVNQTVEFK